MRVLLLTLSAFLLSACLSIDAKVNIAEDGRVDTDMVMIVSQDMYELINVDGGQNYCINVGETLSQVDRGYACTTSSTSHVDDMLAGRFGFDIDPSNQDAASTPITVTQPQDGVLEIVVDLSPMMEDDPQQAELQSQEMKALLKAAMSGHAMAYSFSGLEVIETSGQISADGRTASLSVPMSDFIDKTAPSEFRTTLRYQESGILGRITGTIKGWFNALWDLLPF